MVVVGWGILIVFLTLFWYMTLTRLGKIFKEHLAATGSNRSIPEGLVGLFLFVIRGDFIKTGDPQFADVCRRLRKLLFGYVGVVIAYFVFTVLARPHI